MPRSVSYVVVDLSAAGMLSDTDGWHFLGYNVQQVSGGQMGNALGSLATEVLSATDIGLPLGPSGVAALLPENVTAFGAGLEVPAEEVRIFLALREAAHHRLFSHVPWLAGRLFDAVRDCAESVTIDMSQLEQLSQGIDPADPDSMQRALSEGLFNPEPSPRNLFAAALFAILPGRIDARSSEPNFLVRAAVVMTQTIRSQREKMIDDLVGDQTSELAGARNQDPLEPDARAPSPLEDLAHQLT